MMMMTTSRTSTSTTQPGSTVFATTETVGGHLARFCARSAVTIIAMCVTLIVLRGGLIDLAIGWPAAWTIAIIVGIATAMFVIPLCESRFIPRGRWTVTPHDVCYEPFQGMATAMRFDEIKAMRINALRIELSDGTRGMWVGSPYFTARGWHRLRSALTVALAQRFVVDEAERDAPRPFGWRDRINSPLARSIVAIIGLTLLWLIVTWMAVMHALIWPTIILIGLMVLRVIIDALLKRTAALGRLPKRWQRLIKTGRA